MPSRSDNLNSNRESSEDPGTPSPKEIAEVTIHFKGDIRRIFQASESLKSIVPDLSDFSVRHTLNEAIALINQPDDKGFLQIDLPTDCQRMAQAKEKLAEVLNRIAPKHQDIVRQAISDLR